MAEVIRLDGYHTVELESETVCTDRPARVRILRDGIEVLNIKAEVVSQLGADGSMYPAVKFVVIKVKPTK